MGRTKDRNNPRVPSGARALQPSPLDRLNQVFGRYRLGGRKIRAIRRVLAVALIAAAGLLASINPVGPTDGTPVLVMGRDVAVGTVLTERDLDTATVSAPPDGALSASGLSGIVGRPVSSPVRRGEILTDARILDDSGPNPGPNQVALSIRLDDPAVVGALQPGMRVTLVRISPAVDLAGAATASVLTNQAVILSIVEETGGMFGPGRGQSVMVGVPTRAADAVTSAAASGAISVRFGS